MKVLGIGINILNKQCKNIDWESKLSNYFVILQADSCLKFISCLNNGVSKKYILISRINITNFLMIYVNYM